MAFSLNPNLESQLREIARQQGRDLQSVITEALRTFAQTAPRSNGATQSRGSSPARYPLRGTVLQYDRPFEPAVPDADWESAR